jgi:hypothetical protein
MTEGMVVMPSSNQFEEKATPKKLTDELIIFKCKCGNLHFRHAGYIETFLPWASVAKEVKLEKHSYQVMVCTKCKSCYIFHEQMYDVTDMIDLEAWEKIEQELHKATGPGGNC